MNSQEKINLFNKSKLPIIFQSEAAECGLACVCMVANYYGYKIDLLSLRRECDISLKGAKLSQVMSISERLNLESRAVKIELEDLKHISKPSILHWNLTHYVVLKKTNKKGLFIHDPGLGEQFIEWSKASSCFTGVALEVFPGKKFSSAEKKEKISTNVLWKSISGLKRSLFQIFVLALSIQAFSLVIPYFMQITVDDVVVNKNYDLLTVLSIGFVFLTFVKVIVSSLRSWAIVYLKSNLSNQLASGLFWHLLKLPLDWFEKRHVGDVQSRFASLDQVNKLLSEGFIEGVIDGLMALSAIFMMYLYSKILCFTSLVSICIYFIIKSFYFYPLKNRTEEQIQFSAKEDSIFLESVRSIKSVKIFGQEQSRKTAWQTTYVDWLNATISLSKLNISYEILRDLLFGLEYILIIIVGANQIMDGTLSVGMLYAFIAFQTQFSKGSKTLIEKIFDFKMLGLHLERISDIALCEEEKNLNSDFNDLENIDGSLEVDNISFRYSEEEEYVFRSLSITIAPGESVAIVAPSGFGKTTLMKIMMGLLLPSSGKIKIGGVDIKKIGLKNFRSISSAVMQDDNLLSGTIAQNISLHNENPDMNKVIDCANRAGICEEISKMPMGFNTLVGDMGSTLSGGQMQRILIARALYANPKVIFLDEATSHLDKISEKKVNDELKSLKITRIIIAHRKETIEMADRVIDLTKGAA